MTTQAITANRPIDCVIIVIRSAQYLVIGTSSAQTLQQTTSAVFQYQKQTTSVIF